MRKNNHDDVGVILNNIIHQHCKTCDECRKLMIDILYHSQATHQEEVKLFLRGVNEL